MIIEFLAQHPVLIAGILSIFIFWYTLRMFRRTLNENTESPYVNTWEDYKREARNARIESGTQTEEDVAEIRRQMDYAYSHATGSSGRPSEWYYVSGTSVRFDEFDPYKHPITKEHEVVRCKYCKRQNKATNEVCLGCGATL